MTTLFFKFILSSALLTGLYWTGLRNKASYKACRIFLLMIPAFSILMSTLTFEVYSADTQLINGNMLPKISIEKPVPLNNSNPKKELSAEAQPITQEGAHAESATAASQIEAADIARYLGYGMASVSLILVLLALHYVIKIRTIRSRMKSEPTAEGYRMVRSSDIKTPFSYQKTIFMPANLDEGSERLIVSHEKAHIAHHHYVDVIVSEFVTRILWFNPFLWIARNELRNVHEFEADHEVIINGANIKNYQTTLLEMVMNETTPVVSGFNQSFIRRRFIEMRKSTAGTLGRIGKALSAAAVAALFCIFTFTSCKANTGSNDSSNEFQPGWFVINGTADKEISDSAYNIYLGDKYQHLSKDPDTSVAVNNKQWEYKVYLDAPRAGQIAAIFPGGSVCEATISFTAIPGDTLCLNVHNGFYDTEGTGNKFFNDAEKALLAMRESTNGKTPYLPEIQCEKMWKNVGFRKGQIRNCDAGCLKISEVYFTDSATILKLTTNNAYNNVLFGARYNLQGKDGKIYKFKHTTLSDPGDNWNKETRVYGDYIYYEPMPMDTEEFSVVIEYDGWYGEFWTNIQDMTGKPAPEPNITINVMVDEDADISGIKLTDQANTYIEDNEIAANAQKQYPIYINSSSENGKLSITGKNTETTYIDLMEGKPFSIIIHKDGIELNGDDYYAEWNEAYTYYHNALTKLGAQGAKESYTEFLKEKIAIEKFGGYFSYSFNMLDIYSQDEIRELIKLNPMVKIDYSPADKVE